jgi:hypothetical protein
MSALVADTTSTTDPASRPLTEFEKKLRVSRAAAARKADEMRELIRERGWPGVVAIDGLVISVVVKTATEAEAVERAMRGIELGEVQTFVRRQGGRFDGKVESYRVLGRVY